MWNGGQSLQMGWLNLRLKEAESDFDFCQLSESGSVTLDLTVLVWWQCSLLNTHAIMRRVPTKAPCATQTCACAKT